MDLAREEERLTKKIQAILRYAEGNEKFDVSFVFSLGSQLTQRSTLSLAQERALDNIIRKFHIEEKND